MSGDGQVFGWMADRTADRLFGSRREVGRVAFQAGSCSYRSVVVVEDGTAPTSWRAGIEAVVVVWRLAAALEEVVSAAAGRSQDCTAEEDRRRVDREECSVVAEQVVVRSAAAQERPWVA